MLVLKFGGTSVADADAILRLVAIVGGRGGPRVVVVSALAGVTDTLLRIGDAAASDAGRARADLAALTCRHRGVAASIGDAHRRQVLDAGIDGIAQSADRTVQAIAAQGAQTAALRDRLLATGELWSSRLIAAFLTEAGIASQWLDARNVIRTDARHGNAAPDLAVTEDALDRLARPSLAVGRVVVLAGFIGSAEGHQTTTLGRGGSDYSAAVIGACLNASAIEIWTDVDGVLSADPRVVARARVLPALSYEDAHALATFGAKVLHPKTIEPAAATGSSRRSPRAGA
jgi:aspartate kinase